MDIFFLHFFFYLLQFWVQILPQSWFSSNLLLISQFLVHFLTNIFFAFYSLSLSGVKFLTLISANVKDYLFFISILKFLYLHLFLFFSHTFYLLHFPTFFIHSILLFHIFSPLFSSHTLFFIFHTFYIHFFLLFLSYILFFILSIFFSSIFFLFS